MSCKSIALGVSILVLSGNVNAIVLNTLNGTNYKWLELTETQGVNPDDIKLRLLDTNDVLYGYEYASRALFNELLYSYASWDGLSGYHANPLVVLEMGQFISDFGVTSNIASSGGVNSPYTTVDGYSVEFDTAMVTTGYYGKAGECVELSTTCISATYFYSDINLNPTMVSQFESDGWDPNNSSPQRLPNDFTFSDAGSFLVREVPTVPVPAAIWLFGSGLLGLVGVARQKKA